MKWVIRTIDKFSISLFFLFIFYAVRRGAWCTWMCLLHALIFPACWPACSYSLSMLHLFHYFSIYFFVAVPSIECFRANRPIFPSCFVCNLFFVRSCASSIFKTRQPLVIIITAAAIAVASVVRSFFIRRCCSPFCPSCVYKLYLIHNFYKCVFQSNWTFRERKKATRN